MSEPSEGAPSPAPPARPRWLAWALLGAVAAVGVGAIAVRVTERGRFALPYSTYGAGPDGTRALFTVLREEGLPVEPWTEDVGRLPSSGVLVLLGGCDHVGTRPMSRPERERLTQWIDRGGVFVVGGAGGFVWPEIGASLRMRAMSDCLEDPGLVSLARAAEEEAEGDDAPAALPPPVAPPGTEDVDPGNKPEILLPSPEETLEALDGGIPLAEPTWGVPVGEPLIGLPLLGMRSAGAIELAPGADVRVLASTGGKLGIVEIRRGAGRVVVLASASLFQNRDLTEHGGAQVMMRLLTHYLSEPGAARTRVWFDEYHVGAGERRSMARYFGQVGVVPVLLQLLLGLGLLMLVRSRRFGAVRDAVLRPRSSTGAFVGGLAGLLRASRDRKGTLSIMTRAAVKRIAEAHHQTEQDPSALAEALELRGRKVAASAVRAAASIGDRPLGAAGDLARAVRELDEQVERAVRREA